MPLPKQSDWRFDDIREQDATRAAYLENAPKFEAIVSSIMTALTNSLTRKQFFFGVDHYKDMRNQRVIFQFNVTPQLYDTFFSARTGYRAHYWAFPERGQQANAKLIQTLWTAMSSTLPDRVEARAIEVNEEGFQRVDLDTGRTAIPRSLVQASFTHTAAKIWICERQMHGVQGPLKVIREAREGLPLSVVGWRARAPLPDSKSTFLDLKGGFVSGEQPKDPIVRATEINLQGWS